MDRRKVSSGTRWEAEVGYSRAVRAGRFIYVSGTTATDSQGRIVGIDDAYAQTTQILENIRAALEQVGGSLADIVRTRIYVTDIGLWEQIGRAHAEFFSRIRPAATMVQVAALIAPEILVEIEAEAVVGE